jgi:hypothetical protein
MAGKTIRMSQAKQILMLRAKGESRKRIARILFPLTRQWNLGMSKSFEWNCCTLISLASSPIDYLGDESCSRFNAY